LVLTGGGSGGHLYPAISIAQALRRSAVSYTPVFIGTRTGIEAQVLPGEGFEFHAVSSHKVTRSLSPAALLSAASIAWGAVQAGLLLRRIAPVAVVGTGGYASAGVVLAAALQGIPTLIHEQNSIPGRTNRLLARFVRRVALSFPQSAAFFPARKTVVTGLPVRPAIAAGDRQRAYARFGLTPDQRTLLILGGSLGAQSLNRAVRDALPLLLNSGLQILHQVGRGNWDEHQAVLDNAPTWYHPVPYLEAMGDAYAVADLVCCRAGASTLAELTLVGLPALLVPYPHAHADHQTQNARHVEAAGAAALVPDVELSGHRLVAEVEALFTQPERLAEMSRASRSLGRPDAANAILDAVWNMIRRPMDETDRPREHGKKRGAA
jgi:UDP-N-acetylglucosamine--N-acetylmuramyl-(pentapeptide) pyrophosphoryl-undecaprenol N-acetylglucosamine transferase